MLWSFLVLTVGHELTGHNWQKWKRVFLTRLGHEIYKVETVVLKISNYALKIIIFADYVKIGAIS